MLITFAHTADAAELLMRSDSTAGLQLRVVDVRDSTVTFRLVVTLDGQEALVSEETVNLRAGDTVALPHTVEVKVTQS